MGEVATKASGVAEEYQDMKIREAVEAYLEDEGGPVTPSEVAEATNNNPGSVRAEMRRMDDRGEIESLPKELRDEPGEYDLPERVDDQNKEEGSRHEVQISSNGPETLPLLNADAHASETGAAWEVEVESYMSVDRDILRAQSGGNPDQMAIMTVTGNSMEDTIDAGDQIIIVRHREGDRILQGSVYVWLNAQRGVLIKRAIWQDDGSLTLRPDNDDCPEIHITDIEAPDWRPIGRVFRVMRAV